MRGSFRNYAETLRQTAARQSGYFTASQAVAAGFADSVHGAMVAKGAWIRVMRGIFRLSELPEPDWPELVVYSLWSRDRNGTPQGVYTHDTADAIHRGTSHKGQRIHMTVPRNFRKHAETPPGLILHKEDLPSGSWEDCGGYRVLRREFRLDGAGSMRVPGRNQDALTDGWAAFPSGKIFTGRHSYDAVIEAGED